MEILSVYEKAQKLQTSIPTDAAAVKRTLEVLESAEETKQAPKRRRKQDEKEGDSKASENFKRAQERLRKHDEQLAEAQSQLSSLLPQGSGSYTLTKLAKPEDLYDRRLLDVKPKEKPVFICTHDYFFDTN